MRRGWVGRGSVGRGCVMDKWVPHKCSGYHYRNEEGIEVHMEDYENNYLLLTIMNMKKA